MPVLTKLSVVWPALLEIGLVSLCLQPICYSSLFPSVSLCSQFADSQVGGMLLEANNIYVLKIKLQPLGLSLHKCSAKLIFPTELLGTTAAKMHQLCRNSQLAAQGAENKVGLLCSSGNRGCWRLPTFTWNTDLFWAVVITQSYLVFSGNSIRLWRAHFLLLLLISFFSALLFFIHNNA